MADRKTMGVSIDAELLARLDREAADRDMSRSALVEILLLRALPTLTPVPDRLTRHTGGPT